MLFKIFSGKLLSSVKALVGSSLTFNRKLLKVTLSSCEISGEVKIFLMLFSLKSILNISWIFFIALSDVTFSVILLVTVSKFLLFTTKPLEISSVKSDKIFGVKIAKIEAAVARNNEMNINTLKAFNS